MIKTEGEMKEDEFVLLLRFTDVMILHEIRGYLSALKLESADKYSEYLKVLLSKKHKLPEN